MGAYVIRRLIATAILLYLIVTVVFLLLHLLPGDPAMSVLGGLDASPTEEDIAATSSGWTARSTSSISPTWATPPGSTSASRSSTAARCRVTCSSACHAR
jgi:ABC-type microcin C transport system permease subunit YejB